MEEVPLRYACTHCGRVLEPHEYAGCAECGSRGRRLLAPSAEAAAASGHVAPPEPPDWDEWVEWFGGAPGEAPPGPDHALESLPHQGYVSSWVYIGAYLSGLTIVGFGALLLVVEVRAGPQFGLPIIPSLTLALIGLGLATAVCYPVLLLETAWKVIQDGLARMAPSQAVTGCLVPLYNLYGVPVAVAGFAADFNRFAMRHSIGPFRAASGLYEVFSACFVASAVPCLTPVTLPAVLYLAVPLMTDMCKAINAVADAQAQAEADDLAADAPRTGRAIPLGE
ncbi:MAG: hydrogenase maturation nickel metallochaperone HypA [Armatimonadetes bacterium]|nr:hydrogenase maturation nickel metallochaperone HypA [Armatimonadota bacterium]